MTDEAQDFIQNLNTFDIKMSLKWLDEKIHTRISILQFANVKPKKYLEILRNEKRYYIVEKIVLSRESYIVMGFSKKIRVTEIGKTLTVTIGPWLDQHPTFWDLPIPMLIRANYNDRINGKYYDTGIFRIRLSEFLSEEFKEELQARFILCV